MPGLLNIGVIGLGVMGQRMLARLAAHARLRPLMVWDADPQVLAQTVARHPHLRPATSADALIRSSELRGIYIATPPQAHIPLTEAALDAGLAVLCEKPLSTDADAARACIARIERERRRAAVNFSLAASAGLSVLQQTFGIASRRPLGALRSVELELSFAAWPRPWQADAGAWLSGRLEGGFTREVISHFIFVLQRVLGPAHLLRSTVRYPVDGLGAETALDAELLAAGVPVRLRASVGGVPGAPADHNRMLWRASEGEIELSEWFGRIVQRDGTQERVLGSPEQHHVSGTVDLLLHWMAMIEGHSHSLPGFAEALAVQQTIEALLAGADKE